MPDQLEEKLSNVRLAVYPVAAWREEGVEAVIEEHTGPQFGNCDERDVMRGGSVLELLDKKTMRRLLQVETAVPSC
jgi:hypothetical protein